MRFLSSPNLPCGDVGLVAASGTYPEIPAALRRLRIKCLEIPKSQRLSQPIQAHADLLCHPFGNEQIFVAKEENSLKQQLSQFGFTALDSNICLSDCYPRDCLLNAARIDSYLFANPAALDENLKNACCKENIQIIPINQGYAKCSIAIVAAHAIMTENRKIAEQAHLLGFDVLLLQPGFVKFPGYPYGFIGGACGLIGPHKLAFTGSLQQHPQKASIIKFLAKQEITAVELTQNSLLDIGGILPLLQE